ncbi:MAG: methyltransferase [Thermoguttaceae bacterium]
MLEFQADDDYRRAAEILQRADFSEQSIQRMLERKDILAMAASEVPRILRRTAEPTPLNTLIRLLFIGLPAEAQAVREALHPVPLETWTQGDLLCPPDAQGQVEPRVQIWPVGGLLLLVDLPWRRDAALPADFVVPPGPLTLQLANLSIDRPCRQVLDLGTGSGALALMVAPRAETVLATDANPRALAFTRFNVRLNQIDNVRCLAGDLFDPVAGQQFDLVLCNPPFVISPTQRFMFRDSGERGDVFCRRLVRAAVDHVNPGGFFQFTANIAHRTGRSWKSDLEEWFEGLECDVLVFVSHVETASEYAMTWIHSTESKDPPQVARRYDAWTEFFEREQIEAISYLFVTLRRASGGRNWIQIEDPPCRIVGPCGEEVLGFFACRDVFSDPASVDTLLTQRVRLAAGVRLTQEYVATGKGLELSEIRINKTGGLQYPLGIHRNVAGLLAECDGTRSVRSLLEEMASTFDFSWNQALPVVLPVIRTLIERGVLVISH